MSEKDLFTSVQLGNIALKNKFVMAPLTRSRSDEKGLANDLMAKYYAQRAGAGLIISEATNISPYAYGYAMTPGIYTEEQVESWKKITQAVHDKDGKIFCQLWHCGRISHKDLMPNSVKPMSASIVKAQAQAFTKNGKVDTSEPQAMSHQDIKNTIKDYVHAAKCAKEAGFDGIEIHSANGYLLHQFLASNCNRRDDQYGGSIENRTRFPLEVISACLEVWDPGQMGVRIAPVSHFNDIETEDPQKDYEYYVSQLNEINLAYIHVIEGHTGEQRKTKFAFDYQQLKNKFRNSYMSNNCLDLQTANELVQSDKADLVCFGRKFIANPDLVARFKKGAELNELREEGLYGGDETGYTDYPFMDS
ncbi:MAG: alkene reductase [Halobacteriovoraceae bacterium]|nr:alkene reductase [Halobacteriovoraceae bacterium]|tara:strand:- start:1610 stop:2695 length:1086 start_codon:yes stop_codon:yes gene_type:complete